MRILYVSDSLKQRYGVTSVIMNYLEHFEYSDIQLDLLVYDDSEGTIVQKAKQLGCNVYFMPKLTIKGVREFRRFLISFFEKYNYDIVHSHFNQIDGLLFKIAKNSGVKYCISHSHNTKLSDYPLRAVRNRILCWNIGKNADVWAACSVVAGKALFGKRFNNSSKKLLVYNGIDCKRFEFDKNARERIRNEFSINNDTILLGHVGSFKIQKNQKFLIKMFAELLKTDNKYKLMLVGDGNTKDEIEKYVIQLGIKDNVIFTGMRSDVNCILSAMDIFILPSLYEGLPVIGVEAQTSGLECIFSAAITKEVDLTGVHFIGLDEPIEKWIQQIKRLKFKRKCNAAQLITDKGYNIEYEAKRLLEYYHKLINE